jgi:predicted transposase/invertase (TIGR01784 family)
MSRRTAQLFDLMFKSIIKDASPSAIVHLINGIYKKNYPLDTQVTIEPNELIKEHPKSGKLEKIVSDIIITLSSGNKKDTFIMEAQIDDDLEMMLRIFNYSTFIALEQRTISNDGSYMQIEMPSPAVIYWESSKTKDIVSIKIKFPGNKSVTYKIPAFKVLNHSVSELGDMALLLPFYILKIRKELEKKGTDSAKRKALSKKLEGYIVEIDKVLKRQKRNNYITAKDAAMLLRRLLNMNMELYGEYPEFTEVDMTLKKLVETGIDEAIAKAEKKSLSRTAKAMKSGGEAMDKIMRYTGLSRREIMAL